MDIVESMEERELEFVMSTGIVKDGKLSKPHRIKLSSDKWNLFLVRVNEFQLIISNFLKEGENVREGIEVNVYDKGGHEFEMMLRKCMTTDNNRVFYALNRGWFSFLQQQRLGENDYVSFRTFRHAFYDKLSFLVTYTKKQ